MENEEEPSLSEPQHKKGEANMGLDKIVERRVRSMIMDLESSGKGTQEEILKSIVSYAGKMGVKDQNNLEQQPAQAGPSQNQMGQGSNVSQGGAISVPKFPG
jgi:hypothetical protein